MSADAPLVRLFLDRAMTEAVVAPVAGGEAAVFSTPSPGRQGPNEDGAALFAVPPDRGVLLLADGVGGGPAGESASALALRTVTESLRRASGDEASLRSAILDGFERANQRVIDLGVGAGTTLAALEIVGDTVRPYHVGDSAILVVGQRGRQKLQTIAHSPVGYALESGLLDESEALAHDERHLISNLVGAQDMRIEIGSPLRLARHDTVLLATDGLFDNLAVTEIVETIRKGRLVDVAHTLCQTCVQRMLEPHAEAPSKPDDLTALIYRRTS